MILVTGGTGFIGGYLLAELAKNDVPVRAIKRSKSSTAYTENIFDYKYGAEGKKLFSKINWIDADIMDIYSIEDAMDGVDEVYHCAAEVSLRDDRPEGVILTAEKGTENMVNAALGKGVKKFCHVSSVAALGKSTTQKEITEENFEDFSFRNSPYSIGKHLAEAQVWRANAEGLNVVVVLPSIVLGPWLEMNKGGSMALFKFIDRNSKFYTDGIMGYVHVKDVVDVMLRLMKENIFNERYIVNSENTSFHDLYSAIAVGLGKPIPKIRLNKFTLKAFRAIYNLTAKHKISRMMLRHATGQHIYSNKKVLNSLKGYKFTPIKDTIEETAKYFLNEDGK
jgi:dihydroflavonol-4-reductase